MRRLAVVLCLCTIAALRAENPKVEPTLKDVKYGPHERHTLNFWKAQSDKATPVVVEIHGGGWLHGQKSDTVHYHHYLANGISVVSINYRLCTTDILPAPLLDAARAVQFVRSKAAEWNLDKTRLAVTGGSAGGCTSLWLAYHDDLADPDSDDPVARESTKPTCAAVGSAQSFVDAKLVEKYVPEAGKHAMIHRCVGARNFQDALDNYEQYKDLYVESSAYTHVDGDDPPVLMRYGVRKEYPDGIEPGIHSARFGVVLKEKADQVGAKVYLFGPVQAPGPYSGQWDFLQHLLLGIEPKKK